MIKFPIFFTYLPKVFVIALINSLDNSLSHSVLILTVSRYSYWNKKSPEISLPGSCISPWLCYNGYKIISLANIIFISMFKLLLDLSDMVAEFLHRLAFKLSSLVPEGISLNSFISPNNKRMIEVFKKNQVRTRVLV